MPGVQRAQHRPDLRSAALPEHQTIGTHPHRGPNQVVEPHLTDSLDVRPAHLEVDHVGVIRLQFGGLLDAHDPFVVRNEGEHRREERGLARARRAADQDVRAALDQRAQDLGARGPDRPTRDEFGDAQRTPAQGPQADERALRGQRRQDRVKPRPVRQAPVGDRGGVVQALTRGRSEAGGQGADGRFVQRGHAGRLEAAAAVHPHATRPVDQHIRHRGLLEQVLERARSEDLRPRGAPHGQGGAEPDPRPNLADRLGQAVRRGPPLRRRPIPGGEVLPQTPEDHLALGA